MEIGWIVPAEKRNSKTLPKRIFLGSGHLLVGLSLCFKARLSAKPLMGIFFILMELKLVFTRRDLHLCSFWKWESLSAQKWNKSFTHIDHRAEGVSREGLALNYEYLLPPQWVPVLDSTHSLLVRSEHLLVHAEKKSGTTNPLSRSAWCIYVPSLKWRRNHLSYACVNRNPIKYGFRIGARAFRWYAITNHVRELPVSFSYSKNSIQSRLFLNN